MKAKVKNAHTSNSQMGMGDYYGRGIKQKVGRIRQDYMGFNAPTPKKLKTPPKNLA